MSKVFSVVAAIALLAACTARGDADAGSRASDAWVELKPALAGAQTLNIAGTVHRLDVEGGVWVIRDGASTYQPTNLPEAFRREGLPIETVARRATDMVSVGMSGTLVELVRIRQRAAGDVTTPAPTTAPLRSTSWVLEDLAGAAVVTPAPTLEFGGDGTVSGNASCNMFRGPVTVRGGTIAFGPLVSTRKGCTEPINRQETQYLAALADAERFEIKGGTTLYLHVRGRMEPLRFAARQK